MASNNNPNNANGGGTANNNTTHRRSRSWLDGTMDIISDARNRPRTARSPSPAPRPRRAALQTPPASPGGGGVFSALRSASPTPGQQMILGRMPSQDAMDMSVHNDLDSSAHGGRSVGGNDLHDAMGNDNSNLDSSIHGLRSANSTLTTKMADMEADYLNQITNLHAQVRTLHDKCRLKDAQLETLESDAATAEKDLDLLEMSKHTIADLKAQLYSLQDQVEDAEYAKQEEIDKLTKDGAEKERLLREQILTLEAEVEELKENGGAGGVGSGADANNASSGSINANGSVGRHVADADIKAYEDEIAMLKEQLTEAKPVWGQIDALRKEKDREISELRSMLRARDDTIASLQGKNSTMTDDLTALEAEVDRLQSERHTATDREEELTVLRSTLAEREEQLSSTKTELEEQIDLAAQLTKEIAEVEESHKSLQVAGTDRDAEMTDMTDRVATLEEQLKLAKEAVASLTKEVDGYQTRVTTLEEERDDATTNLEAVRKELAEAKEQSGARAAASEDGALLRKEVEDVTRERVALEGELTKKLATAKKENLQAITKMEIQLKEKEKEIDALKAQVEDSVKAESDELATVRMQLQEAQQALVALDNEMKESQKAAGDKADGELRQLQEQLEERAQEYETIKESLSSLELTLKDRDAELKTARDQITSLETSVEELENGVIKPVQRGIFDAPDGEGGTNGNATSRIHALEGVERELKAKLEDRDMTISTLVKSSTRAESNMYQLKAEVASLQEQVKRAGGTVSAARSANSDDSAKVKELQDKVATLIEAKEKSATQHRDQILERDAAISKLVKSSVSLEQHITSLQAEVERLRKKKSGGKKADGPAWEELHRLQQESEIFAGQIIEQDEEIEGLRGELDEQRAVNASLSKQVADLKSNGNAANAANESKFTDLQAQLDEVQKINKAQREELRDLQYKLRDAQAEADRVADLEVQLREAQSSPSKSRSISSFDVDEIEEFEMREELEHLRRSKTALEKELRQMKANDGSPSAAAVPSRSSKIEEELRQDLEDAIATKEASEKRLTKQIESLRKLKDSAKHEFEETLRERDEEIASLKESVAQQELITSSLQREIDGFESVIDKEENEAAKSLRAEISSLKSSLNEKSVKVKKLEQETDDLRNRLEEQTILATKERRNAEVEFGEDVMVANMDKDALVRKVYELEGELKSLESDYSNIRDLRKRLKNAEEDRSVVEQKVAAAFEKKIILIQTEKDAEIDRLRKDLTVSKEKLIELENERAALLRKLDDSNIEIQEELEERLQQKNIRIMALEQTLSAQEQVLGNMQAEMDQLQSGMDKVSLTRRAEIEEMEQELMESAQAVTKYEREIVVLKDKLEDVHLRHSGEVDRLKQRIKQLESETPYERSVREQRDDHKVQELNEKIDQLKWRLTDLQDDNQRLREKLEESNTAHKRGLSSTERYRTAALQEQVHKLSQKNKDLEKELTVTASSTSYANGILNNDDVEEEVETSLSADGDSFDIDHNTSPAKSSVRDDLPPPPPPSSKSYGKSARDRSTSSKFGGVGASFHRRKTSSGANGSTNTPGSSLKKHFGGSRSRSKPRPDDPSTKTEETF